MNEDRPAKYRQAPIDVNLPTLPFYRLTRRASNKLCGFENEDQSIKIVFANGKPSTLIQKVLVYLTSKAPRKEKGEIDTQGLKTNGIKFTIAELCDFLGLNNQTNTRKRIKEELKKLGSITIHYLEKFAERQGISDVNYVSIEMKQLFKIKLYDNERNKLLEASNQLPLWENEIKFDEILLQNLENSFFRFMEVSEIQKIKSPTAIRIHGIIKLHDQSRSWKIGLIKLAKQIPIQTKSAKHTKEEIKKACEELKQLNVIITFNIYRNTDSDEIVEFFFKKQDEQPHEILSTFFLSGRN